MKKLLFTSCLVVFFGGVLMAQEPAKAAAKKKTSPITIAPTAPVAESKAETEKREQAKKKHYEALTSGKAENAVSQQSSDDTKGTKKKKVN